MLCEGCADANLLHHMHTAQLEHVNRQAWRRLFPVPFQVNLVPFLFVCFVNSSRPAAGYAAKYYCYCC